MVINIDNLKDNKNTYIELLNDKYEAYATNNILLSLENEQLEKAINIISILSNLFYLNSKNCKFLSEKINKLDKKIQLKIYISLINISDDEEHQEMKNYITKIYINNINYNNIEDFIIFIKSLNENDYLKLMNQLKEKYIIKELDFYSNKKNINIELLCKLQKYHLFKEDNIYSNKTLEKLNIIYKELESNELLVQSFFNFLSNDKQNILDKLNLFSLLNKVVNSEKQYKDLNNIYNEIKETEKNITFIKDQLSIYHKDSKLKEISEMNEIIKIIMSGKVNEYNSQKIKIDRLLRLKSLAEEINNVKTLTIFNIFYKKTKGNNSEERFNKALNDIKNIKNYLKIGNKNNNINNEDKENILNSIRDELTNTNGFEVVQEIEKIMAFFKIHEEFVGDEITIIVNSKKYENDINSLIYFFNNFQKDDDKWNDFFSAKYKNISEKEVELKTYLEELKEKNIYDYLNQSESNKSNYLKLCCCLYDKKQAYDFLLSQSNEGIKILYDKIEPNSRTISYKDIEDTIRCVGFFNELKNIGDNFGILKYIQTNLDDDLIARFENFSQIYSSVIELNQDFDFSINLYNEIKEISTNANFIFSQDKETFFINDEKGNKKGVTIDKLKSLKNKIYIKQKDTSPNSKNDNSDTYNKKCNLLITFKNLVNNIEIIYDNISILRIKGSSLPILINISFQYKKEPIVNYFLNNKATKFEDIQKFLYDAKSNIINKLDKIYKEKTNLRFIYGKQFDSLMKHLEGTYKIDSIIRFILNDTNNQEIKDGYLSNSRNTEDYVYEYDLYNNNSFKNISDYISSLFQNNDSSLENHYNKLLIRSKETFKGIYLYESEYENESKSMEDDILQIYLEMMGQLPIAQNILISNKETSYEEMQAFFNRAILCQYNTLFIVEINDSFSDFQQKIMNNFIDKLLIYKNNNYNQDEDDNVDKTKTDEYLDSCIIFIYNNKKRNESFLNEIQKIKPKSYPPIKNNNQDAISKSIIYKNTHIYKSQICGLGKTTSIKNAIKSNLKKYIYFPLGGYLTKDIIFKKLNKILKKAESISDKKNNYTDIAIHLDLYENKEKSVLNEFLFSFLITKFYSNNENIIYIPKNIEIYVEIPNCFFDFIKDYDILKSFEIKNITFENMPGLKLPQKTIEQFDFMLGLNTNKKIYKFILDNIEKEEENENENEKASFKYMKKKEKKYSYHQINIFINLFISQYYKFECRLQFSKGEEDVTNQCIESFSKGTQYFTLGAFAKLLTDDNENKTSKSNKKDNLKYIDLLSQIYENDLKNQKYKSPLIFTIKTKEKNNKQQGESLGTFVEMDISEEGLKNYNSEEDYLEKLKEILSLDNPVSDYDFECNKSKKSLLSIINKDGYIITNDNFKKMILILYRIAANIPVILMGETGCGKTALIKKLNQLLNNGEETLEIININPGINDKILIEKMERVNEIAKTKNELWVFFDELNTCDSLALLTEIFIKRTYEGAPLQNNIRIIGACNPYRKKKEKKKKCGLRHPNDDDNELIYLVNLLPQSLMYYVFNFGSIDQEDEKKYILSIISKLFSEKEKILKERTKDAISKCHEYLRETFDPSIVSLREMTRFTKCCEFFVEYYKLKNKYKNLEESEELGKIKAIINSIYLCYYIRLVEDKTRNNFDTSLYENLIKLVNYKSNKEVSLEEKGDLLDKIDEPLKSSITNEIIINNQLNKFKYFSQIIYLEEAFLLNEIELDKGIGHNKSLRENILLLFISLVTKIPLIIMGKPGSGKSLSSQLIYKSMRGKYSKSKFFQLFPNIIQSYFQGSYSTTPEDVENIFEIAAGKLKILIDKGEKKENLPISMILFDELGLAERSKSNPLKVLHSKLEYDGNHEGVSFVGISNWTLDASKINRTLSLSVPNLDELLDDLKETSLSIAKSIYNNLIEEDNIFFNLLPKVYYEYKKKLDELKLLIAYKRYEIYEFNYIIKKKLPQDILKSLYEGITIKDKKEISLFEDFLKIKKKLNNIIKKNENDKKNYDVSWLKKEFSEIQSKTEFQKFYKNDKKINLDFHGNRDFYYLIKGIATELNTLNDTTKPEKIVEIIEEYIERNFGGMEFEIDLDLDIKFESFNGINGIKNFLNGIMNSLNIEKNKKKKITSVMFFKEIFNKECIEKKNNYYKYIIKDDKIKSYDLKKNIIRNINDSKSRYLLLEINPSLAPLIHQDIIKEDFKKQIFFHEGSPFINDNNNEYQFKMINQIQNHAGKEHLIILQNLNQIYAFLYDLFNMNYIVKDGKNYARICQGNLSDQLTYVNESFKCIIMVDKKFIDNVEAPFLNRFEKVIISFDKLLDDNQKNLSYKILNQLKLKDCIKDASDNFKINYKIKDLLIGSKKEDILGLVYYFYSENNNNENNNSDKIEQVIEEKIFKNISKLLPQDIIINLPDKHILKDFYNKEKSFYNLYDYINDVNEEHYKISIIYTFNNVANLIDRIDEDMNYRLISEIRSEAQFKNLIEGQINNKKNNSNKNNNLIYIHFDCYNSKYLSFIIPFVNNNYGKENYRFIFIVHVKRNFTSKEFPTIYTVPGVYYYVNQLFIDNLSGHDIKLNDILQQTVKEILEKDYIDLKKEFEKMLRKFLIKKNNKNDKKNESYYQKIFKYFEKDTVFMEDIIEKAKDLIEEKGNELMEQIYKNKYINKNSIDIVSILLEYIRDKIFDEYLLKIFYIIEDNNFLSTLLALNKHNDLLNNTLIKEIKEKYIKIIKYDKDKKYIPKFNMDFVIPGFYNFYQELSNYINLTIIRDFSQNEKRLRYFLKGDGDKVIEKFHEKENIYLKEVNQYLMKNSFVVNLINKIPIDLILNDYITFYLLKNNPKIKNQLYNDNNHKLINLILNLRFNKNNKIIKDNENNQIKIILIKIIWLESNKKYIDNILRIFNNYNLKEILKNNKLLDLIGKTINSKNLRYITNDSKNPKETKEVNECFYIIIASICLSITSIELTQENFHSYFQALKSIIKIIQNLNDDLLIFLNEMYIIDEIIKIYDVLKINNKINIQKVSEIINNLKTNADILQKDEINKIDDLIETFNNLYDLIKECINYEDDQYYDLMRYICYKEIKKISDINYRATIFEYLIKDKELIIKSNDILQLLLKKVIIPKKEHFKRTIPKILNEENEIMNLIENLLNEKNDNDNKSFVLSETLLYYFEKNSHIYLNNTIYNKKENILLDDEPFEIFKECLLFLVNYIDNPKKLKGRKKNICKLFTIGYIKTYLYTFISLISISSQKINDTSKIIKAINDNISISKIIRLYVYKIIYNKYNRRIDVFVNPDNIQKYKLNEYNEFNKFINFPRQNPFDYTYNNFRNQNSQIYESFYKQLEKLKQQNFETINISQFNIDKLGIDVFFFATCNLILSCLKFKDFEKSATYINFYNKVCFPLFKSKTTIFPAIQFFYCPEKFIKLKEKFNITPESLEILFFSYRYCLNLLDKNKKGNIYSFLYNKNNINDINKYYYPGNDIKDIPIYNLYSQIKKHFLNNKSNIGCYVCLCRNGYYLPILDDYDDKSLYNKKCPKCGELIGLKSAIIGYGHIKRDNYYRIVYDEKELKEIKDKGNIETNLITIDNFKQKYIERFYTQEKGITVLDENHLKKDNKVIRNLSQISYRILNFILYSHLFFARLYTENKKFDNFKPKSMGWMDILIECWEQIRSELKKKKITVIEFFMNYIFFDISDILNKIFDNKNFEQFMNFEEDLEKVISKKIKDFLIESKSLEKLSNPDKNDRDSSLYLLNEKYQVNNLNDYPFYNDFYYSDYINEDFLLNQLYHKENNKYPVLFKYLNHFTSPTNNNIYSLNYLKMYNEVLNMFNDKYSHIIERGDDKKIILENEKLYKDNKILIDEFIKFYNQLKLLDGKKNPIRLSNKSDLSNFFIDDQNEIGKSYKKIYQKFIEQQNREIQELLDIKIREEIFDQNCKNKVNIQNIKEDEIFSLNLPNDNSFIDIVFDCSYRDIVFNNIYESYNQFQIDYYLIEEKMTEALLKNKKLFNDTISNFIYKNEDLIFENIDVINKFNNEYNLENLILDDNVILYQFYLSNKENNNLFKEILNDFITLIDYLNTIKTNIKINGSNANTINFTECNKIFEVFPYLSDKITNKSFIEIFNEKQSLTINKLTNLFEYYQILIYEVIKNELNEYKKEMNENQKQIIKKYFENNHQITKEIFASAIRRFIVLFLSKEKNKENKIKNNTNNIINYLNIPDIWNKKILDMKEFDKELEGLENLNVQLNQVLSLYEELGEENTEEFYKPVINQIQKNEELKKKIEEMNEPKMDQNNNQLEYKNEIEENKNNDKKEQEDDDDDNYYDLKNEGDEEELYGRD